MIRPSSPRGRGPRPSKGPGAKRTDRSPDPKTLGEALEFMRVLWELDHALRRTSKSMKSILGVTGPQRLVIRMIGRFPGLAPGDLASLLHVDPSSLTGVLERLGRSGFVVRSSDPADGRRARLSLTPRGRALDRVRSGTVEAAVIRGIAAQPRSRIVGARRVLEAVTAELAVTRAAKETPR
ncbi:MAG TPA: MarR family transcriptional regulator [Polyangiaceae bacterium]